MKFPFWKKLGSKIIDAVSNKAIDWLLAASIGACAIIFWNPMCKSATAMAAPILCSVALVFLIIAAIPTHNAFLTPLRRRLVAAVGIVALVASAFLVADEIRFRNSGKVRILVAPFKRENEPDTFNVTEMILNSLKKSNDDDQAFQVALLEKPISEATPTKEVRNCLKDCDGAILIWGSYSSNQASGTLRFHVSFSDEKKCLKVWSRSSLEETSLKTTDGGFEANLETRAQDVFQYLKLFSMIAVDAATCKFKNLPAESLSEFSTFLKKASTDPELKPLAYNGYLFLSNYYFNIKAYNEAEVWMTKAIDLFPTDPELLNLRSIIYSKSSQQYKALDDLKLAIQKTPHEPVFLANLSLVYQELGAVETAYELLNKALQMTGPKSDSVFIASLYSNRGGMNVLRGKDSEALQDFTDSVRLYSDARPAHQQRTTLLLRTGKIREAEAGLKQYLGKFPDDPFGTMQMCMAQLLLRQLSAARYYCREADRLQSDSILKQTLSALENEEFITPVFSRDGAISFYR